MRKLALCAFTAVALALVAGPAAAHRDPFQPAVVEGQPGPAAPAEETGVEPVAPGEPAPASEGLPFTGFDPEPWFALAFVLVAFGAGALAAARIHRITA